MTKDITDMVRCNGDCHMFSREKRWERLYTITNRKTIICKRTVKKCSVRCDFGLDCGKLRILYSIRETSSLEMCVRSMMDFTRETGKK